MIDVPQINKKLKKYNFSLVWLSEGATIFCYLDISYCFHTFKKDVTELSYTKQLYGIGIM